MKAAMLVLLILLAGCSDQASKVGQMTGVNQEAGINEEKMGKIAIIETNKGTIKAELYDKAPITTQNFMKLAEAGFYDGLTWHRYVPGFVIQGGDPDGDGTGGSKDKIKLEIKPELTHIKGALGMARSSDPDSATSQFYITLDAAHQLDGGYAVFGHVTEGMDVVLKLRQNDKIVKITIQ